MKKTIILSAAVLALAFGACSSSNKSETVNSASQNFEIDTTTLKSGDVFYQCEMDAKVISDKPGTCPTCGMDLEKKEKK